MKELDFFYENLHEKVLNEGAVGFVSTILHKTLELGLSDKNYPSVLELGAGHGQHFQYVSHKFESYLQTDLVPLWERAKSELNESNVPAGGGRLTSQRVDAEDLSSFDENQFDRVIVTCLLAHLNRPETALKQWRRVVRDGGLITIYVPSEPGLLLRLLRTLTTARKLKKNGADARYIQYVDHRNYYITMNILIKRVFSLDKIRRKRFPIPCVSWNFSLWDVYQITVSKSSPN
jgi:SAM-dependent methyltransferase